MTNHQKGTIAVQTRRYPWYYGLFLMGYYITNSVYQGFMPVYYQNTGLSARDIGILLAAVPLVSIFTQPLWGGVGDRMRSRTRLLRILSLAAMAVVLLFPVSNNFLYLLLMLILFSTFYTSIQPLGDSIILEALSPQRHPFGPIRLCACLGFAVASMLFGIVLDGRIWLCVPLTAGLLVATFGATYALPNVAGHQTEQNKTSMWALLKNRELLLLLIFMVLLQINMGYFYAFFSIHFTALEGGTSALLGWCYFISAVSEVPFLLYSDKLFEKFGAGKMLCVAAFATTLRWILLSFLTNPYAVMATQVCHGGGFIVMTVCMSKYVNQTVPPELKARGQMLLSVVGYGLARVAGSFGGGLIADAVGVQRGFLVPAAIGLAAICIFVPYYLKKAPLNGETNP